MLTQCSRRSAAQHYKMNSFMHKIGLHKIGSKRPLSSTAPSPTAKCVPDMSKTAVSASGSPFSKSAAESMAAAKSASSQMRVKAENPIKRSGVKFAVQFPQEEARSSSSSDDESKDAAEEQQENTNIAQTEEAKSVQFNQRVKVFVYKLSDEELTWKRENNATRQDLSVM